MALALPQGVCILFSYRVLFKLPRSNRNVPVSYYGGNIVSGTSAASENTDSYISDIVDGIVIDVVLPHGAGGNHAGIRIIAFLDGEGGRVILGTAE